MTMAGSDRRRGISVPGFVRTLLLVMTIGVLWWLWKEVRPVPEVPSPEDNPTERLRSIDSLVREGENSVPLLLEMLADPDPKTRRESALALGRIGSPSEEVRDAIRARIDDDDAGVRLYAFSAYKLIWRDEFELGELAVRLLADPDSSVRDEARMTLAMGSQEVVRAVIPLLSHESRGDQLLALEVLSG
jgi:HEAT repeat protein